MVDLHCHILPGIDDGPPDMDQAVGLARAQVAVGTTTVVATPHVHWDYPDNDALAIAERVLLVKRALKDADVPLEVRAGAECALTRAIDLPDDELDRLRLGGSPWLLVECPFGGGASGFQSALLSLAGRGHRILLAHPERIAGFAQDRDLLARLVRTGAMLGQLTTGSLAGRFGRETQRFSWWLLEQRLVHLVASDAHSVARRPPGNVVPLREAGLEEAWVQHLAVQAPEALLAGEALPRPPAGAPRSSGLRGLLRRAS